MLLLRANTDDLELVTSATADIEVHLSAMQIDGSTPPVVQPAPNLGPLASITTATTTQIVDTSGITSGHNVNIKHLNICNNHASTSCDVTVQVNDGTNTTVLCKVTLLAGEELVFTQAGLWVHYDVNGGMYPALGNIATQAEMEAGTSLTVVVPPGRVQYHPGVAKFWGKFGTTGNTVAGYNVDSPTDQGTGDIIVNVTTDFSSTSWCSLVSVEMTATTYGVANAREVHVRSGGQAAGTLRCDCIDNTATTNVIKDPTSWFIAGFGDQ